MAEGGRVADCETVSTVRPTVRQEEQRPDFPAVGTNSGMDGHSSKEGTLSKNFSIFDILAKIIAMDGQ